MKVESIVRHEDGEVVYSVVGDRYRLEVKAVLKDNLGQRIHDTLYIVCSDGQIYRYHNGCYEGEAKVPVHLIKGIIKGAMKIRDAKQLFQEIAGIFTAFMR